MKAQSPHLSGPSTLQGFLDAAPDALVVVDRSGRIVLVNQQAERIFGYSRREIVGEPVEILIPESLRDVHRGHRNGYLATPKTRPMGSVSMTLTGRKRDGTELPIEISLSPMHTDEGLLVTAAIRDITERKKLEDKLRRFLEAAPDAIVIVNAEGKIVLVNSQAKTLFGYGQGELLGLQVEELVPPRYRGVHPGHRTRFFVDPKIRPMGSGLELFGIRKDGTEFPVEISLSPIPEEDGTLVAAAIRDIADRKRVEMQLRRSLHERETLLMEIHHRVKNNLQVISSLLYLQRQRTGDATTRSTLDESRGRIQSIALVHEKLYQAKELSRIDFQDYLKELVTSVFGAIGAQPPSVKLQVHAEGVFLDVERAIPCALIVNELITNALKHAFVEGKQGAVRVAVKVIEDKLVELEVEDDGRGVPEHIEPATSATLGMQLVHGLTKQLKGTLEIRRSPGTTFRIRFPAPDQP